MGVFSHVLLSVILLGLLARITMPAQVETERIHVTPEWLMTCSYVWEDLNNNGRQDADEPPIAGVRVSVYPCGMNDAVSQGWTDTEGRCKLRFLGIPGRYWLSFDAPGGYVFTRNKGAESIYVDSDPGPDGRTTPFYNRGLVKHVDAGLVRHQFTYRPEPPAGARARL